MIDTDRRTPGPHDLLSPPTPPPSHRSLKQLTFPAPLNPIFLPFHSDARERQRAILMNHVAQHLASSCPPTGQRPDSTAYLRIRATRIVYPTSSPLPSLVSPPTNQLPAREPFTGNSGCGVIRPANRTNWGLRSEARSGEESGEIFSFYEVILGFTRLEGMLLGHTGVDSEPGYGQYAGETGLTGRKHREMSAEQRLLWEGRQGYTSSTTEKAKRNTRRSSLTVWPADAAASRGAKRSRNTPSQKTRSFFQNETMDLLFLFPNQIPKRPIPFLNPKGTDPIARDQPPSETSNHEQA